MLVRIGPRPTFSTEHTHVNDGRLAVNTVLDVDDATAQRWIKNRVAVAEGSGTPAFEDAQNPAVTAEALRSRIAQLQAQLAAAEAGPGQNPNTVSPTGAANPQPVNAPSPGYIGQHSFASDQPRNPFIEETDAGPVGVAPTVETHDLTEGAKALGDTDELAGDGDDADEDDGEPHRTRVSTNARKRNRRA